MTIGYDAKRAFHNSSGLGNYSRSLISAIQATRPEVNYILFNPKQPVTFDGFYDKSRTTIDEPQGLYKPVHPYWRLYRMAHKFKNYGIDIYHGLSGEIPKNIPSDVITFVTVHDVIFIRFPELYRSVDRYIYKKKLYIAVRRADVIVATSEQTKRDLIELCDVPERKIHVVYQTCGDVFFKAGREKVDVNANAPYFLSVGAISPRKNFEAIIKAMPEVSAKLIIAGRDSTHRARLEKLADKLNVTDKVEFKTDVDNDSLVELYQKATAFVYASKFEGFGIPILEAQASGCPVITANTSCLPEIAGPHSAIFEVDNKEQLISHMNDFLRDPNLRSKKSQEGLSFAAQFEAPKLAEELMSLYEKSI